MTVSWAQGVYVLARGMDYLGTAVFFGGLAFLALLWPGGAEARGARRLVATGWLLGLIGTVSAIGLEGAWATGRPLSDAVSLDLISQVLDVHFGRVWFARALLWVLAGVVLAELLRRGAPAARSAAWRAPVRSGSGCCAPAVTDILAIDQYVLTHTVWLETVLQPVFDGTADQVVKDTLAPVMAHINSAHLERSPLQQVNDILAIDQYIVSHTVWLETVLAPLAGQLTC